MKNKLKRKHFYGFSGRILHCWERRSGAAILLSESLYRGRKSFDLREWYRDDGMFRPTKRGIQFHASELEELFAAIETLREN